MTDIWIEPHNRWRAIGQFHANGSMTGVTVEDLNQVPRGRDLTFSSMLDFISWVGRNSTTSGLIDG